MYPEPSSLQSSSLFFILRLIDFNSSLLRVNARVRDENHSYLKVASLA